MTNSYKINVSNLYDVHIGSFFSNPDNLDSALTPHLKATSNIIILYDNKVAKHLEVLQKQLQSKNIKCFTLEVKPRDSNKSFTNLLKIANRILDLKAIDRSSIIITLGGGTIGDIGGFCASILLRGLKYIQIPTTLLSQVDSSIGGKTGVNTKQGKNLVGTFYNPALVIIDSIFLKSLPLKEKIAGMAEVIKYGVIDNRNLLEFLKKNSKEFFLDSSEFFNKVIYESLITKKKFVEDDFFDNKNIRAFLNFGHTFGHGVEFLNNYKSSILHGQAVAIGMKTALEFSLKKGFLDGQNYSYFIALFKRYKLPLEIPKKFDYNKLVKAMLMDKKNFNQHINLILLNKDLMPFIYKTSEEELINFFKTK